MASGSVVRSDFPRTTTASVLVCGARTCVRDPAAAALHHAQKATIDRIELTCWRSRCRSATDNAGKTGRLGCTAMVAAMRTAPDYRAVFLGFMSSPWVQGPESWMQGQLSGFQGMGDGVVDSPRHLFERHSFGSPSAHERKNPVRVTQSPAQGENVIQVTHNWHPP